MAELRQRDLRRILSFAAAAEDVEDDSAFPPILLEELCELIPSDSVTFSELDRVGELSLGESSIGEEGLEGPPPEVYWRLRHQEPLCHHQDVTRDWRALKLSDFVTPRELRRREVYWEWLRPWGVEHELDAGIESPLTHTKLFMFARSAGRDYSERDRGVLEALRPWLARRYAAAQQRRQARQALALLEQADSPVLLIEPGGRIAFATPAARELLERHFGEVDERLPSPLAVRDGTAAVETPAGTVVVRSAGTVLLLEERFREPRLTPREREILELVGEGMTNAEVAGRLWLSAGTVRRHLENAFEKLGVHTRPAAVARLRAAYADAPR